MNTIALKWWLNIGYKPTSDIISKAKNEAVNIRSVDDGMLYEYADKSLLFINDNGKAEMAKYKEPISTNAYPII